MCVCVRERDARRNFRLTCNIENALMRALHDVCSPEVDGYNVVMALCLLAAFLRDPMVPARRQV